MNYPVFVYGTLKKGYGNYRLIKDFTTHELPATTKGELYDLGAFPGLIEGSDTIKGQLMYIDSDHYQSALSVLDTMEGYDENNINNSLYIRKLVTVHADNQTIEAYAYFWNGSVEQAKKIEEGEYRCLSSKLSCILNFTSAFQAF
ncbi:gamma-glutamylcyclotransferase family protein [Natranaerobius trueperi]|nr:gamma-glutamylcyclotransferase family protein [Natranaerobius trueperi]